MLLTKLVPFAFACGASALPVVGLPWFGGVSLSNLIGYLDYIYINGLAEERTIYQVLKDDEQYTRLVKAIDLSENVVSLLNDPSESLTFFAVPDSKLPPSHRKPHQRHHKHNESLRLPYVPADDHNDLSYDLGNLVERVEELEKELDSDDKEKRKEALARIIPKIVAYHIVPGSYKSADLIKNSTYATNLTLNDGSMDWEPLRLSVVSTPVPPRLKINLFVEVTKKDVKAKNGVIHQISHPLLPPPSIFQEAFFVPEVFSFFTTAIQRVGLVGAIDRWRHTKDDNGETGLIGASATTAFVPTSGAFKHLPRKLKAYLFSPFGRKALKKLLEYHIVPSFVFYTDYFHNATSHATEFSPNFDSALETHFSVPFSVLLDDTEKSILPRDGRPPLPELVYEYNATLPTLLEDHSLCVHVARYKSNLPFSSSRYFTSFKVNGRHVGPFDVPSRNGALHVVSTLLDPRKGRDHHCDHGEPGEDEAIWDDWEEWLPQWATEN